MTQTLQMILDKQAEFQEKFGYSSNTTDVKNDSNMIHCHSAFVIEEIYEMLRELPFHKPWKDYSDWDNEKLLDQFEKAREEWTDAFIFLMNVSLFLGMDEQMIEKMYLEKLGINKERQVNPELGYVNV